MSNKARHTNINPAFFFGSQRSSILRFFMVLAKSSGPVLGRDIAAKMEVSVAGLERIARYANTTGLIRSATGIYGGYELEVHSSNISVIDMIGQTIKTQECTPGMNPLLHKLVNTMKDVTLKDLIDWDT